MGDTTARGGKSICRSRSLFHGQEAPGRIRTRGRTRNAAFTDSCRFLG